MRRIPIALIVLALIALGLAACGGGDDSTSADAPASASAVADDDGDADEDATASPVATGPVDESVQASAPADGSLVFDQKSLKAKAGTVELDFDNPSAVSHNICVRSSSGDELGCSEDVTQGSSTLTVDLQPGKYTVYCGEPGHKEGGMAIPLTVG